MLLSNCREAARTAPRGRNKFSYWPVCVACEVVLTSRKPLEAQRWFPFVEETGGKIFRSNGKHPGDVRIAPIADPLDSEVANRNEGTIDVPKVISTAPTSS